MKKLALIGMVVAGLLLSTSVALAKPTGMTKAEYQALIARSEAMNLKYGQFEYAQPKVTPTNVNQKLEEIGAWAVPTKQTQSKPLVSEKLSGLGLPTGATVASSGGGFDWNDAGIGAVLALAGILGVGAVLTVRHQHQPIPH
ncbi:MAG TPA: hypothetical protein VFK62_12040 [Gaiellaceae bacterium]|nr:hypothetical protein [Gaiellaceae bacterium]